MNHEEEAQEQENFVYTLTVFIHCALCIYAILFVLLLSGCSSIGNIKSTIDSVWDVDTKKEKPVS